MLPKPKAAYEIRSLQEARAYVADWFTLFWFALGCSFLFLAIAMSTRDRLGDMDDYIMLSISFVMLTQSLGMCAVQRVMMNKFMSLELERHDLCATRGLTQDEAFDVLKEYMDRRRDHA